MNIENKTINTIKIPNLATYRMRINKLKECESKINEIKKRIENSKDEDERQFNETQLKLFANLKHRIQRLLNVDKRKINNYCIRRNIRFKI